MAWFLYKFKRFVEIILYYFNFNGVNQAGETYRRLIPDPLNDDFGVRFTLYDPVGAGGVIAAQNLASSAATTEFRVILSSSVVQMRVGGTFTNTGYSITSSGTYDLALIGTTYTLYKDAVQVATGSFTRGAISEPTATFTVGARHNGTLDSYGFYYQGGISNVEVYPISPTVFDAANYPMDELSPFKRDVNGGADMEIINWNESDEIERP